MLYLKVFYYHGITDLHVTEGGYAGGQGFLLSPVKVAF